MKKCIIFDIDGTLANGSHRQHLVATKPKNWPAYKKLAHLDTPIVPVVSTLFAMGELFPVFIVSGRGEEERQITLEWLESQKIYGEFGNYEALYMRPLNDSREDSIIKREILNRDIRGNGYEPLAVFDDRPRVIRMWREEGIFVFNVDQRAYGPEF